MNKQELILSVVAVLPSLLSICHYSNAEVEFDLLMSLREKHIFGIKKESITWDEAQSIRETQLQGNLVSIHSSSEQSSILNAVYTRYGPLYSERPQEEVSQYI